MPLFHYKCLSRNAQLEVGEVSAASLADAKRLLQSRGLRPLSISPVLGGVVPPKADQEQGRSTPVASKMAERARASRRTADKLSVASQRKPSSSARAMDANDVLRFTSEMAVLLRAGLPIDRALRVQIDSAEEGAVKTMLESLLSSLKAGQALSVGLVEYEGVFGSFYISMVRSGEASGSLSKVLGELAAYLERAKAVRSSVISAMVYPVILAVVAVLSIVVMLGFVVPEFETLFEDMGEALPLLTRLIIGAGDMIAAWWWLLIAVAALSSYLAKIWLASDAGVAWWHQRSLNAPIVGGIILKYQIARFARTMGTLLRNGVAMLKATDIAVGTVDNTLVASALADLPSTIKRGGKMSETLDPNIFSPVAVQMIRVGEESGSLDTMLIELASVYESEVEEEVKRALTLLEPALILGMGGMIAIIIMAILMGILSVNNLAV